MTHAYDPELAAAATMMPKVDFGDVAAARAVMAQLAGTLPPTDLSGVDLQIRRIPGPAGAPDVELRIFRPDRPATAPVAAVYDVHGGGYALGDAAMDDGRNAEFVRELGVVVVSVDYRLAPETSYPGGLEDVYTGLVWLAEHAGELGVDAQRIAVHGVSAGGGLCAALALLARDRGGPHIAFQFLSVPEVDDRLQTASMTAFVDTPGFNRPNAERSWDHYLGAGVRGTADVPAYAAPARATDLAGLPPAYVAVMQFDPLRDEGIAYALALQAAGVPVELHLFPGAFHGSAMVAHAAVSRSESAEGIAVLRRALTD